MRISKSDLDNEQQRTTLSTMRARFDHPVGDPLTMGRLRRRLFALACLHDVDRLKAGTGRSMTRPFRRFAGILAAVLLVGVTQACGPSVVPLDTVANISSQAENLAYSVASQAGCGSFEDLDPAGTQGTWHFTCQRGATSYDMVVFGGDDSRQSGLKSLQDAGHPFVAKGYYAVTILPSGSSKEEALGASLSPSLLDPFK
jgi:hypothetical protein